MTEVSFDFTYFYDHNDNETCFRSDTARQSVSIMRYLEENGFPVPGTLLTKDGEAILETEAGGEKIIMHSNVKRSFLSRTEQRSGIFSCRPRSLKYTERIA